MVEGGYWWRWNGPIEDDRFVSAASLCIATIVYACQVRVRLVA